MRPFFSSEHLIFLISCSAAKVTIVVLIMALAVTTTVGTTRYMVCTTVGTTDGYTILVWVRLTKSGGMGGRGV